MKIVWPKELDPEDGWPGVKAQYGSRIASEPRLWSSINTVLGLKQGSTLAQLIAVLGGPTAYAYRTSKDLNTIQAEVLQYFREHRKRPTQKTSRAWARYDRWLAGQGSSLSKLCVDLGVSTRCSDRSLDSIRSEIRRYYRKHGKRPSEDSPGNWRSHSQWLRKRGQTLSKLCTEVGLKGRVLNRDLDSVRLEIREFYREHGKRPSRKVSPIWNGHDQWLRRNESSSLSQLCNEMGLP